MTFTPLPHYNGAKAHGRDRTALSAIKAEIEHAGGKAMSVLADVTKSTEIQTMRRQSKHIFGRIDILVANAGASFSRPGPIGQISEEGGHAFVGRNLARVLNAHTSGCAPARARHLCHHWHHVGHVRPGGGHDRRLVSLRPGRGRQSWHKPRN